MRRHLLTTALVMCTIATPLLASAQTVSDTAKNYVGTYTPTSQSWESPIQTTVNQYSQTGSTNVVQPTPTGLSRQSNGNLTYYPVEPLTPYEAATGYGNSGFEKIASVAYPIAITLFSLLALIILVFGGIQLMTSEASETMRDHAKKRIQAATLGLAILVLSYLIISTVNPNLLKFKINITNAPVAQQGINWGPTIDVEKELGLDKNWTPQEKIDFLNGLPKNPETCEVANEVMNTRNNSAVQGIYDILNWIKYGQVTLDSIETTKNFVKTCVDNGLI